MMVGMSGIDNTAAREGEALFRARQLGMMPHFARKRSGAMPATRGNLDRASNYGKPRKVVKA